MRGGGVVVAIELTSTALARCHDPIVVRQCRACVKHSPLGHRSGAGAAPEGGPAGTGVERQAMVPRTAVSRCRGPTAPRFHPATESDCGALGSSSPRPGEVGTDDTGAHAQKQDRPLRQAPTIDRPCCYRPDPNVARPEPGTTAFVLVPPWTALSQRRRCVPGGARGDCRGPVGVARRTSVPARRSGAIVPCPPWAARPRIVLAL